MLDGKCFFKWSNVRNISAALLIPTLVACGGDSGSGDSPAGAPGVLSSDLRCFGDRIWSLSGNSYISEPDNQGNSQEFPGCAIYWRYNQSNQCHEPLVFNSPSGSVVSLRVSIDELRISGISDELDGTYQLATAGEEISFYQIPVCD